MRALTTSHDRQLTEADIYEFMGTNYKTGGKDGDLSAKVRACRSDDGFLL